MFRQPLQHCLKGTRFTVGLRRSSADATAAGPLIHVSSIPAPHCGSIRVLALNNPKSRNAISRNLLAELNKQIQDIASEQSASTRALILTSNIDESFCAGADLKERKTFTQEECVIPLGWPIRGALVSNCLVVLTGSSEQLGSSPTYGELFKILPPCRFPRFRQYHLWHSVAASS